jgi:hypothetical protein
MARNGSLGFAEGLACAVGAKPNVPFAGSQRILKYFVRGQKKLKHEALGWRVGKSVSRCCPSWSYLYVCPLVKICCCLFGLSPVVSR